MLGSAFVSLVEPHRGHERAYNRWYEDDHIYSTGAMAIPGWIAARRWVATRELRALRRPASDAGSYLSLVWIATDHWERQWAVLGPAVAQLREDGRMFDERSHVHTAFYDLRASFRADDGPSALHALDHPYLGLVMELCDGPTPERLGRPGVDLCAVFSPHPWPEGEALWFDNAEVPPNRSLLLWFLTVDPRAVWDDAFGWGDSSFLAPFVPTVPGTDRYVDELR